MTNTTGSGIAHGSRVATVAETHVVALASRATAAGCAERLLVPHGPQKPATRSTLDPGGDHFVEVDRMSGMVDELNTDRQCGALLHRARHAGRCDRTDRRCFAVPDARECRIVRAVPIVDDVPDSGARGKDRDRDPETPAETVFDRATLRWNNGHAGRLCWDGRTDRSHRLLRKRIDAWSRSHIRHGMLA